MAKLGIYKLFKDVPDVKVVNNSIELKAYLPAGEMVIVYNNSNKQRTIMSKIMASQQRECIIIDPDDRVMIPTGFMLDKPAGFYETLHTSNDLFWKHGLTVDHDFGVDKTQLHITLINNSKTRVLLGNGDVIGSLKLNPIEDIKISKLKKKPK